MKRLVVLLALSACAGDPDGAPSCDDAAAAWTRCTGSVPAGFDAACTGQPDMAAQITGQTCEGLASLDADAKADGVSSLFSSWTSGTQPSNFADVGNGVYRGQHLLTEGKVRYLAAAPLDVKTVLDLEMYNPQTYWEKYLVEANGIDFVGKPMMWNKVYDDAFIDDIVSVLGDPSKRPIYVHCYWGYDRTGLIVALHRVVNEGMAPIDAFHDWKAHMPGADRCAGFPELNQMFNRKVRELGYDFQIDTPNCAAQ
jgi:hypothetical protein